MSTVQPASRLALQASGAVQSFGCGTLAVSLATSSNTPAAAPYPVVVALSSIPSGGVDFFSDATCATPAAGGAVTLPTDSSSATVSFRPKVDGSVLISAAHPDFLPTQLVVPVAPGDGGSIEPGAPIAVIAPAEQTVDPGVEVRLDATGSRAEGTIVAYEWTQPEGPSGVRLSGVPRPSFSSDAPGRYVFELVVVDAQGRRSLPATATVVVRGEPEIPPVGPFGCACTHGAGGMVGAALLLVMRAVTARNRRA